jgi:phosphoglycolate phosphatase
MSAAPLPLRAVAFDLDGTLTDSAPGICSTMSAVLVEAGHPVPPEADVRAMIGLPLADILARHAPGATAGELDQLVSRYKAVYTATVIPSTLLFPRAWSLLRACRAAGLELALVTAKTTDVAERVLARCRVRGLFASVVGGDRAARPKPYPDLMRVALAELGVPPGQTLLVGDGAHDVEMGRGSGVRTCGVAWGVHEAERLAEAGADHIVHSMAELRELILGPAHGAAGVYSR